VTPSKEETLNAIKALYEGQGTCEYKDGSPPDRYQLHGFGFRSGTTTVTFERKSAVTFVDQQIVTSEYITFNPADLDTKVQYDTVQGTVFRLIMHCRECASRGGNRMEKQIGIADFQILFCDRARRARVTNALSHLRQFYKATTMPF
jgi:hypothetical protein